MKAIIVYCKRLHFAIVFSARNKFIQPGRILMNRPKQYETSLRQKYVYVPASCH